MQTATQSLSYQMTKPAIVVWPSVVVPKRASVKLQNEPRFECDFLFKEDHPDLAPIMAMMKTCATAEFGVGISGRKFPLQRGDKIADDAKLKGRDREFMRGYTKFQVHANVEIKQGPKKGQPLAPPRLVVLLNGKYLRFSEDHERALAKQYFYSGVFAVGTFTFVAYPGMGGGVSAFLNEILSLNTGERIKTGIDDEERYGSADQFKGYIGHQSAVDPTAGADIDY